MFCRKQGYFWQSSKTETMESYSRNILGKTVKTKSSKGKGKIKQSHAGQNIPTKVTVLKDQPLGELSISILLLNCPNCSARLLVSTKPVIACPLEMTLSFLTSLGK